MASLQFSLRGFLVFVTGCSVACFVGLRFGSTGITTASLLLLAVIAWVCLFNFAPDATKYFTVFAILGLLLFSLVSIGLLRAREDARRQQTIHNLREFRRDQQQEVN